MGHALAKSALDKNARVDFIRHLLNDIKSLEYMLDKGHFETGIHRIGAEQEFCLISKNWRPEKNAEEILKALKDPHFTTELAKFNLEINLDPVDLEGNCFDQIKDQLDKLLSHAKNEAHRRDTLILLTGILPTVSKAELSLEYMTPKPRYWSLNEMVKELRGGDFNLHIKGVDELFVKHDSVLMEACNTSFQLHLQIDPEDFIDSYNWAQAIAAPVLGICANSPLLLGRELWNETRIALFQQSIDTRTSTYALKDQSSRVSFGDHWEKGTAADIFKNDIAQHKIILSRKIDEDSYDELLNGKIPKLKALNTHNGSVYRWNRPCYGISKGKPHLRIENRYIPAGPTIVDQMANFAFWVGLMIGRNKDYDLIGNMDFKDVKSNFIKVARNGKETVLRWRGRKVSVRDLIVRELLPIAKIGLEKASINQSTIDHLLGIIEERAHAKTGAQWMIENYRAYRKTMKQDDALLALTKSMYQFQQKKYPIHKWPEAPSTINTHEFASNVGHIMSTRLFTVYEEDLAELATQLMIWKNIHHVPVEDKNGQMSGILTWSHMEKFQSSSKEDKELIVKDIMAKDLILAHQDMPIEEAIDIMKKNEIGCLPVLEDGHLIGIITKNDIINYDNDQSAQQSA